jgi:tetratricopeptide (TPR) repeat protein
LLDQGFITEAGKLFERALRYAPDDAGSTAGLARAFIELGRVERAVSLLNRAISLTEQSGNQDADALMDLSRLLAEKLNDLPQAIARIRQIPSNASSAIEARALEGRWRAAVGDIAGASLAFARLRDAVEFAHDASAASVPLLVEAAHFERDVQRDPVAAERHLAVALRISPHDAPLGALYRELAADVAKRLRARQ